MIRGERDVRRASLVMFVAMLAGCSHALFAHRPATHRASRYRITIRDASIVAQRPDGRPWHLTKPDQTVAVVGEVVGVVAGQPELGAAAGKALAGDEEEFAPTPYVELHVADRTLTTLPAGPTLSPSWNEDLVLDVDGLRDAEPVAILVKDGFDDGVIGDASMTLGELLARDHLSISDRGSVALLTIAIGEIAPRRTATFDLWVPGNESARDLQEHGADGWIVIDVKAGDAIRVAAEGEVCVSDWRDICQGPEGILDRALGPFGQPGPYVLSDYNYDDFAGSPHAELVGLLSGTPVRVGGGALLQARRDGQLVLFVNDSDAGNNRGGFKVHVEVNPPNAR